ncbi:MAG: hypothetical protein ABSD85_17870 [Acidimicrobiales bacterium]|jgi:hypothetical protein
MPELTDAELLNFDKDRLDDWNDERATRLLFDVPSVGDRLPRSRVTPARGPRRRLGGGFVSFAAALGVSIYFAVTSQD